ncbi:hypothetical protein EB796_020974 [Bugula neritina]|uniref:Uncharacterized protein n=1 Tax=Bugula neritina TaxID=10212 RepID=A0A7J7J4S0_BUGNE|nr:hypothetical protein EB796_020974 [Bugula neritina]
MLSLFKATRFISKIRLPYIAMKDNIIYKTRSYRIPHTALASEPSSLHTCILYMQLSTTLFRVDNIA